MSGGICLHTLHALHILYLANTNPFFPSFFLQSSIPFHSIPSHSNQFFFLFLPSFLFLFLLLRFTINLHSCPTHLPALPYLSLSTLPYPILPYPTLHTSPYLTLPYLHSLRYLPTYSSRCLHFIHSFFLFSFHAQFQFLVEKN